MLGAMKPVITKLKWENNDEADADMQFRLTYEGKLLGASRSNTRAAHKHDIRKVFHKQLKRLWEIAPHFGPDPGPELLETGGGQRPPAVTKEELAEKFDRSGYNFVPLVTEELSLRCDISILFLRPDPPGSVLNSGDIDNRIKTLFDALRMPGNKDEFGNYREPTEDEKPFFCLLEDDKLITSVAVETDLLLDPVSNVKIASEDKLDQNDSNNKNDARLVITVKISPIRLSLYNIHLG